MGYPVVKREIASGDILYRRLVRSQAKRRFELHGHGVPEKDVAGATGKGCVIDDRDVLLHPRGHDVHLGEGGTDLAREFPDSVALGPRNDVDMGTDEQLAGFVFLDLEFFNLIGVVDVVT